MLAYALMGVVLGFAAAVQPGPFQAYIVARTLGAGWRRTLPASLAPLLSDGPIILLVLVVLSEVPSPLQRLLRVAGGLFVLYLGWSALREWSEVQERYEDSVRPAVETVWRAVLVNVLNPGPYIYWSLVAGPQLVAGWNEAPVCGVGFIAGFYGAMVGTLVALILVFGLAGGTGPRFRRTLTGISAVVLVAFGAYQLYAGLAGSLPSS